MKYLRNTATIKIDLQKCTGCFMCIEVCPHAVFAEDERKVRIDDSDSCMECGACVLNCSFKALSVDKGVGCAEAVFNSMIKGGDPSCDCGPSCSGEGGKSSCC